MISHEAVEPRIEWYWSVAGAREFMRALAAQASLRALCRETMLA